MYWDFKLCPFRDLAGYYPVDSGVIEIHLVGGDRGKERAEVWGASGQHLWTLQFNIKNDRRNSRGTLRQKINLIDI